MADKKISELPAASALDTNDLLAVVEDGTTVKATIEDILALSTASGLPDGYAIPTFTPAVGTDQTTTMTAAIGELDADAGGVVMIPEGTFYSRILLSSHAGVTFRGAGKLATTIVGPTASVMVDVSGTPRGNITFEDMTFDAGSAIGVMSIYPDDFDVTFRRCRFINLLTYGITTNGSVNTVIEDCEFDDAATATAVAVNCNSGTRRFRWIRSTVRFMGGGINFDISPHDDIDIDGGLFDGGWYLLPTRGAGYTNSGGTVTYAATTVTDSAASFATLPTPADVNVRALPVLESGSTGTTYLANYLEDATATFETALVKPGHIVRTSTKWAVVTGVASETKLYVEEWIDSTTYRPTAPPAAATAYNVHRVLIGLVASNTATVITIERWVDFHDGASVTPSAGTLYEVLIDHGEYTGIHAAATDTHEPGAIRRIRVHGGCHITRVWNDQLSIYGSDARLTVDSSVLIDHGQDFGITSHGDQARIFCTSVHNGAVNIACTGADSRVEAFVSGAPYINIVNTTWLADMVISGSRTRVSGSVVVPSGAYARRGISVYGLAVDGVVDAVDLTGVSVDGYSVAEFTLLADAAAGITNTLLLDAPGVVASTNATGTRTAHKTNSSAIPRSGFYFGPTGTSGTLALGHGISNYIPFVIERAITVTRLSLEVTTGLASSTVRLGIYDDVDGVPTNLIVDGGTIDGNSVSVQEVTISQALTIGRVWAIAVKQGAAGTVTVRANNNGIAVPYAANGGFTLGAPVDVSATTGALPATASAPTTVTGGFYPRLLMKVS